MKITACLITKEKEYPKIIMDRLNLGFFDEILIKTESPSVYQRYLLAKEAKNDIIYVQDDDCLVNYQILWKCYDGCRLTNTMTLPFQKKYEPLGCTLVGWGCYFNKSYLKVFDKYIAKYGVDDHLLREADRIFTYLNRPFNTIIQPHEDLFQNQQRMSTNPDGSIIQSHFTSRDEALEKCKLIV